MPLATQFTAANDPVFIGMVEQAIVTAAIAIGNEASSGRDTRKKLSLAVLSSPSTWALLMAQGVASQGLDKTSTDAAINTAVSSLWNAYAG